MGNRVPVEQQFVCEEKLCKKLHMPIEKITSRHNRYL